ncbi:MAG: hypothetical protein ACI9RP_003016 [Cyclobacteriaceae bacterium]
MSSCKFSSERSSWSDRYAGCIQWAFPATPASVMSFFSFNRKAVVHFVVDKLKAVRPS